MIANTSLLAALTTFLLTAWLAGELTFLAGDYLRAGGSAPGAEPLFLDAIPIRFGMTAGHYHVPLLLAPYGYTTYRGS